MGSPTSWLESARHKLTDMPVRSSPVSTRTNSTTPTPPTCILLMMQARKGFPPYLNRLLQKHNEGRVQSRTSAARSRPASPTAATGPRTCGSHTQASELHVGCGAGRGGREGREGRRGRGKEPGDARRALDDAIAEQSGHWHENHVMGVEPHLG